MEDYTNKYKGEQVDLALFGGEYQEGVLTAYCSIEDVPHIELNGHILIPGFYDDVLTFLRRTERHSLGSVARTDVERR